MDKENITDTGSWIVILSVALLFVCWGLFIFYAVGDKGPPEWDFGVVRDIPGESAFSTERFRGGKVTEPQPQHVSEKPAKLLEK